MGMEWLWRLGGRAAGPRDGQSSALAAVAMEAMPAEPAAAPALPLSFAVEGRDPKARALDQLHQVLAAKVAEGHLSNRRQISYPLVLNFGSLSALEGDFLMAAAALALASDGDPAPERLAQARERLARLGADERLQARLARGLDDPLPMAALAARAAEFDKAAHAYAVSLVAIGPRSPVGRMYLAYLAARLGLGQEVVGSLNRRFLT